MSAGCFQSQRVTAVEQALVGSTLDVDALVAALEAMPKALSPSPTPGNPLLCFRVLHCADFPVGEEVCRSHAKGFVSQYTMHYSYTIDQVHLDSV